MGGIDCLSEMLRRTKDGLISSFNLNRLVRLRIAPHPRGPMLNLKNPKLAKLDPLTVLHCLLNGGHEALNDGSSFNLGEPGSVGNFVNKVGFRHG